MKKLILAVTVAAFTVAAHAGGEGCAANKDKAACSDKAAAVGAKQVKAEGKAKGCCPAGKEVKQALASPKAAKN